MVKKKPKHLRRGVHANREGPLLLAKQQLADAIDALARSQRHALKLDDRKIRRVKTLSLYVELEQAVAAHRGGGGGKWSGQFPFWADAFVLLGEIDAEVMKIHPAPHCWGGWTVARLTAIEQRKWRPQDCQEIYGIAAKLQGFTKRAEGLFALRAVSLPDECPECGEKTVYRDQDGEEVRSAALQINEDGATCGACHANWPIERLELLGKILGYGALGEPPPSVKRVSDFKQLQRLAAAKSWMQTGYWDHGVGHESLMFMRDHDCLVIRFRLGVAVQAELNLKRVEVQQIRSVLGYGDDEV